MVKRGIMSAKDLLNQIKNNNIFLLCEVDVSNEEYDTLIEYTKNKVSILNKMSNPSDDLLLALTLVQIAIREYKDGNYWRYFWKKIGIDNIFATKQTFIGKIFLLTINKYNLFTIEASENENAKYVENIKAHAFIPNNYLYGYYDFLYSFYEGNLLRTIPNDLSPELIPMQKFMKNTLSLSNDSVKLDNSEFKKSRTYRLLKASRIVFANMDTQKLSNIMLKHLQILDNFYYDNIVPDGKNRFNSGFAIWAEKFENELIEKTSKKRIRKRGPVSHKPYFEFINDKCFIVIPPQKFREDEVDDEVHLFINGIDYKKLDIYNQWGIKVSEEEKIEIDDIFDSYEIMIDSKTFKKYKIPKQDYRIFNDDWKEILYPKHNCNYIVYKKNLEVNSKKNNIITYPFGDYPDWCICQADFEDNTIVTINDVPLTIKKEFTGKTDLEQFVSNRYYIENENGEKLHTVYRHISISFIIKKINKERVILHCNNEKFTNIDIPGSTTFFEIENDNSSIGVEINLNNILVAKDGVYKIWIDEPQNKRLIIEYLLISNLRCSPKASRYFLRKYAKIITNGNYDLIPVNCMPYNENNVYSLNLDEYKEAKFYITVDDIKYIVKVPVHVVEFNYNNEWVWTKPKFVWIDDFSNDLFVKLPGAIKCRVYLNNAYEDSIMGNFNNGIFEFDLTAIRNEILSSNKDKHLLHIVFEDTKEHDEELFVILKSLWFNKIEYQNINGQFCVIADYYGNANLYFDFYDRNGQCVANHKLIQNGINIIPELAVNDLYDIVKHITQSDEFGFDEMEIAPAFRMKNQGIISTYENCSIKINHIIHEGKKLEISRTYTIKNSKKYDGKSYIGTLYEKQNGERFVEHILFPRVLYRLIDGKNNQFQLYIEEAPNDWIEPIYDKLNKRIITDDMATSKNVNQYKVLFDDNTVYKYNVRREK